MLKDKRKKLKETLDRVLKMYAKDDQAKWTELKDQLIQYERKRIDLVSYYEAVKHAQQIQAEAEAAISPTDSDPSGQVPQIPSMYLTRLPPPTQGILKKNSVILTKSEIAQLTGKEPPGVPPYPPEDLVLIDEDKDKSISFSDKDEEKDKTNRDLDNFMKEIESVQKGGNTKEPEKTHDKVMEPLRPPGVGNFPFPGPMPMLNLPPPPNVMFRPPGPPGHLRIPPPPPPRLGIRLPPGPPPGMPRIMRPGGPGMPRFPPPMDMPFYPPPHLPPNHPNADFLHKTPNVLSAAPQLNTSAKATDGKSTIEAKPQIRNLAADVTKFLPSSLRMRRDQDGKKTKAPVMDLQPFNMMNESSLQNQQQQQPRTKDDAYLQFMQEMQDLL